MKNNKGFTLIEMLVVIAVIGILSAATLTALGPARSKAKDTKIISALNQIRAVAETLYTTAGTYPSAADMKADSNIAKSSTEIAANGGTGFEMRTNGTLDIAGSAYAAFATLNSSTKVYCIDSSGYSGELAGSGPGSGDATCQ